MLRSYACVRQTDQSDCGPAALATVALHHGLRISREKMRDIAGTDRIGTNLLGMVKAGEQLGFTVRAVKGPYQGLAEVPLPAIAHVKNADGLGHFVVLYRVRPTGVVVADPARGIEKLSREAFAACWTGYLLILSPRVPLQGAVGAPVRPVRRLVGLLLRYRRFLVEAFACAVLMTGLGIVNSYFVQHLVDSVLVRGERHLLGALSVGMLGLVLFRTLFGAVRQYLMAYIGRQAGLSLVAEYARHILGLPMRFFETREVGEILSRVQDAAKVRDAVSGITLTAVVDGTMVLVSMVVLWLHDGRLALVSCLFVPLLWLSALAHQPAARRRSREAMEHAARLSAHLVQDVAGIETVKALGIEGARTEEGESRLVRVLGASFAAQKLGVSAAAAAMFVTGAAAIVILWVGGERVIAGAMSIGELMFFNSLLAYMLQPLERLASINLQIQDALVAIDRLYQVLELDREVVEGRRKASFGGLRTGIELREVSFQYGSRGKVLDKLNLRIPAGATVAILGESGSGKTTLLKLLARFYDPTEGQIVVDEVDIRDYDVASLRLRTGVVPQEPFIFTGTIRDNIAMARPEASFEEILAAARGAGLEETIARLPDRFDTVVGERGANLSGGQRQRLAIARALLKKPDLLIFDEATSHLDTATERAIQESLKVELAGRTVVLVAHRLSTVRDADIIHVMDRGTIVEAGTHAQLLARDGRYSALWRAQTSEGTRPPALRPVPAAADGQP